MKKRILSLLLCVCMLSSLLPIGAMAAEEEPNYLVLGDSISSGYGLASGEDSFAELVAAEKSFNLIDQSYSGEKAATLLEKLQNNEIEGLADADVITLTIGGNDLMAALYSYLTDAYNADRDEADQITVEQMQQALLTGNQDILTFAVQKISGFASSEQAAAALQTLSSDLTRIITTIRAANPTIVIVVGNQYNPYAHLAEAVGDNPLYSAAANMVASAFDKGVTALNNIIAQGEAQGAYIVADVYTAFENAAQNPCNAGLTSAGSLNLDFHPNAYGHQLIADLVNSLLVVSEPPEADSLPFSDVSDSDWFYDPVVYVYNNGLMTGTSDTTFAPNIATTRGMLVSILHRLEGAPSAESAGFSDVSDGDWYAEAVNWAASVGVVNGMSADTFAPNAPLTREQMAAILYNYTEYKGIDVSSRADLSGYADADQVSEWAADTLSWANAEGLVTTVGDNRLAPQESATRAQLATILQRALEDDRSEATEFTFELTAGEERVVENLVFNEDVTVSGDFGSIVFENCEFNGDIINTAEQATRVILSDGTTVNGNCVFKNTVKEASMDYPMPKFISSNTLNIVCDDCIGSCVLDGTEGNIVFNGETYSMADVEFYYDANTNELVPYEGQDASTLFVGQWWENGEKVLQLFCE